MFMKKLMLVSTAFSGWASIWSCVATTLAHTRRKSG